MRTLIAALLILTGCNRNHLFIHTDFVGYDSLASFHVGTPDPELACPDYGQQLHIAWFFPCDFPFENLVIRAKIRFKNLKETEWILPIEKPRDRASYILLNEAYDETGGILSYKIDLFDGTSILEEYEHALWTELIFFN